MAKKKTAAKAAPKKAAATTTRQRSPGDRVGVMVRIPMGTHSRLVKAAERGGISLNMLVEGLLTGCAEHFVEGRPHKRDSGFIKVDHDPGCYFVGRRGLVYRKCRTEQVGPFEEDREFIEEDLERLEGGETPTDKKDLDGKTATNGNVLFVLDHSKSPIRSWADE